MPRLKGGGSEVGGYDRKNGRGSCGCGGAW